jgi:hypothetical protein
MEIISPIKSLQIFECNSCNYSTYNKKDYNKHILTPKHKKKENGKKIQDLGNNLSPNDTFHKCDICSNQYETVSGLWKHKKKCNIPNQITNKMHTDLTDMTNLTDLIPDKEDWFGLIKFLIKENSDIKNMVIELAKSNASSVNNLNNSNLTNNSHNKTFNLQFFLNETCKDAMNISEFIENIKIDVSDLENMGRVGYVEGMSSILIKNLNVLDITKRPIHCTDKKREIVYIKDNNIWEKDDEQRNKLHRTIKHVSHKSIKTLPAYREKYPGCEFAVSKFSDRYNKMIIEVMGGPGDNDTEKEDRIIQKIAKYITINKAISIED